MKKISSPLYDAGKCDDDVLIFESSVTTNNTRDAKDPYNDNGRSPWDPDNKFDFVDEFTYDPQGSDGFDTYYDEGDDTIFVNEAYADMQYSAVPENYDEGDDTVVGEIYADIICNVDDDNDFDFVDVTPFKAIASENHFDKVNADTVSSETKKTANSNTNSSKKGIFEDAVYTDKVGNKKINRIKFVEIYNGVNSLIIAQDPSTNAQLIYIFSNGKYTYFSDVDVKRDITQTILDIDPYLFSVSEVNDILARIKLQAPKIGIDDFDSNEYIINFKNGLVDIRTGTLMPHSPQVLSTIQIQCKYTPVTTADLKKYAPVFVSFLRTLTDENRPVSTLILQYLAVILSNINGAKFKKAMILFGEGNTGKSKLIELVQFLLGEENYAVCDIADLEQRFRTSMLFQKRLTGSSDMSFAKISELKIFKNATGGDQLFAEKKGKDGFKFGYKGLFLFATNRLPNFGG